MEWGDFLVNRVAVILSVVLALAALRRMYEVFPQVLDCLSRWRSCIRIESAVLVARDRDISAAALLLPFLLFVSRYDVFDFPPVSECSMQWRALAVAGLFVAFLQLRFVMMIVFRPRGNKVSTYEIAYRCSRNFFILLVMFMMLSVGVMSVFSVPDGAVKVVMVIEMSLFYSVFLSRKIQILRYSCSRFATFLYLCALEFFPIGLFSALIIWAL